MPHFQVTCVLLGVQSLSKLTEYLQILHTDSSSNCFELRSDHTTEVTSGNTEITQIQTERICQPSLAGNQMNRTRIIMEISKIMFKDLLMF